MFKRFLYCFDIFLEANENAFWGFLDDLYYFYQGKISPHDVRFKNQRESSISNFPSSQYNSIKKSEMMTNTSYDDICLSNNRNENKTLSLKSINKISPIPIKNETNEKTEAIILNRAQKINDFKKNENITPHKEVDNYKNFMNSRDNSIKKVLFVDKNGNSSHAQHERNKSKSTLDRVIYLNEIKYQLTKIA